MGWGDVVNRWGLVTAWAVEHDNGRGGRMITSKTYEDAARALFDHLALEDAGELVLWSPDGAVDRWEACNSEKIGRGHSPGGLRGLTPEPW